MAVNAYLIAVNSQIFAVRAANEDIIRELVGNQPLSITPLTPGVAQAMAIPESEGLYRDVVTRWEWGPTNLLGELKRS